MGAPGRGIPSDDVLRSALQRAWEQEDASLYTLERDIGRSPAGLLKFLHGAAPRPATRKKLLDWYVTQPPVENEPELALARVLFNRLFPGLSEEDCDKLLRDTGRRGAEIYRRRNTTAARWVGQLDETPE
ncbi:MAG TPA: hypothetical protein VF771_05180 [Longimicrobiaceae bacterium]